jgi:hypothetical protein
MKRPRRLDNKTEAHTDGSNVSTLALGATHLGFRAHSSCPAVPLYDAALLSGLAECRREWHVLGNTDTASALLPDRKFGSHTNPATDIPLRASLPE